jgi:hypothetical protein
MRQFMLSMDAEEFTPTSLNPFTIQMYDIPPFKLRDWWNAKYTKRRIRQYCGTRILSNPLE